MKESSLLLILLALIAATPPFIAAIMAYSVSVRTDRKAAQIHLAVNGNLTTALSELAAVVVALAESRAELALAKAHIVELEARTKGAPP